MTERRGEKIGWVGGWIGAFCWLPLLSVVWFLDGRPGAGILGLALPALGVGLAVLLGPWRHPTTPAWKLLLPVYGVFLAAVVSSVALYGGLEEVGLRWWNLFWLAPMLLPLFLTGRRTWEDGEPAG